MISKKSFKSVLVEKYVLIHTYVAEELFYKINNFYLQVQSQMSRTHLRIIVPTRLSSVPQIEISSVPQVRVGVQVSCNAISRQSHTFLCNSRIIVHATVKSHSALPRTIT